MRETEDGLWYTMARDMAGTVNVEPIKPRSVSRSMHRPNAPAVSTEDYYRINSFIPMLDHIISELDSMFDGELNLSFIYRS